MPVYTTTLPNGQSIRVMGPSNATPETIQQAALQIAAQRRAAPYVDTGERNYSLGTAASKAFSRGTERLKSGFGDAIPAMVGSALGFDEFAKRQMQEAQASEELIQRKYAPEIKSYKDISGFGDALKFGAETVFEQIPNLATMLVPGAAAPQIARIGAGKLAATELAKRQAAAQGIGVYMGSYALNAPEVFKNIYEETGELATGTSVLFGAAAAALDSVLPSTILKNITPFEKSALAASVLRRSGTRPGITKSVLSGIAKGSGAEALTEGAQEAISISAENFVAGNSQYFDSEDWDRVMESAVRGAVAGGTFRGISEPLGRSPAEPKNVETGIKQDSTPSYLQEDALKTKAIVEVTEEEAKKNMKKEPAKEKPAPADVDLTTTKPDLFEYVDEDGTVIRREIVEILEKDGAKLVKLVPASNTYLHKTLHRIETGKIIKQGVDAQAAELELPYEGFRPPEGMTIEEGIAYYNGLDEIEQINYEPPQETIQDEPTTIDAVDRNKIIRGSDALPLESATGETAAELGSPVGGKVEVDTGPVSPTGERADVVNPALEETVEEAWEEMSISEIPFAKLSSENKQRLREAKEDGELTGQLVDQIDGELGFQESRTAPPKTYTFEGKPTQQTTKKVRPIIKDAVKVDALRVQFMDVDAADNYQGLGDSYNNARSLEEAINQTSAYTDEYIIKEAEHLLDKEVENLKDFAGQEKDFALDVKNLQREIKQLERFIKKYKDVKPTQEQTQTATPAQDNIQESRTETEGTGQTAATVLADLVKEFGNNINKMIEKGKLVIVDNVSQLPANITMSSTANGAFDNNSGISYLVADRIQKGQGRRILLHEIGEHYGLEKMVGKDYMPLLNRLKTLRKQNADIDALFGEVQELYPEFEVDSKPFLQEVMAKLGEKSPNNTLFRRMVGAVKNFLRRLGIYDVNRFSDVDIQDMILNSLRVSLAENTGKSLASSTSDTPAVQMSKNVEATAERREQQRESVSPKSKTTQESRVDNKNIQFSKENPPGGVNPTQDNALFKYAGDLQQKLPLPTKDYIDGVWQKVLELPTWIKKAWTGMLGLQAMVDLYDKYLPSIKKLMNTLERRAAEVETTRAEVDVLGNLGMDVIQGKERRLIDYDEKTGQVKIDDNGQVVLTDKTTSRKYTDGQLKTWEQTTYKLSERDIDPRDQANFTDPDVIKFFNLPPELQALSIAYTEKFEQYGNNLLDAYKTAAEKAVQKDETAQEVVERVVKEFTENRLKFYHPFRRRGDYVLSYVSEKDLAEHNEIMEQIENSDESKDQKAFRKAQEFKRYQPLVQTSRYETKAAYVEAAIRQESADGITVLKAEIDPENKSFRVSGEGAVGIMQEVTSILQKTDEEGKPVVDEAVIKEVAGLFLDALPSQSIKQQSRQRIGTGGYIEDVVGGFIDLGARMATQVANLKYIPEINENIKDVGTENATMQADLDPTNPKDASLQTSLSSVVERLEDSKSFFHNPVAGPISSRFAYLSYLTSIAGNVSSALVNATQLAIIVYPTLVAEYGFGTANRVMGQAFSYYFGGGKDSNRGFLPDQSFGMKDGKLRTDLPEDLQQLYKTGIDNSVFRRGVGYELTEMRKTNAKDFVGTKAKFDALMGWMFQNTERMNREVTYIAGYLAAKEKGDSFEVAEEKSREFTRRSHGTALPEIGPKFFQQDFGKVMFTFKRYGHAMLHLLFKAFNDAYRGESKEVRNIARKQILGIYGASFTFAGLQGVPLYGFTQALAEMMYAMFGDEDEPFDFEESTREIFGDIGYRGPLNKLLNVDIASRTGFANLIWREDPRRISEVGLMPYVLEQGLGPSFSYGLSVNRGLQDMARGNIYRGIEQTLPAFARNPMKAIRYATEGAVNRKGAEITPLNPLDGFLQIFGFTNEDLSLQYARNQSMKQAEKNFNARRSGLLKAAYLARKNGDFDMMREVQSKINDFNRSTIGSANPITGSSLKRSYKTTEDSLNNSVGGITLGQRIEKVIRKDMGS